MCEILPPQSVHSNGTKIYIHTETHTHTHVRAHPNNIYIYIYCLDVRACVFLYIYIFTNLLSTRIHGTRKKTKKPWSVTRAKISRITVQRKKEKSFLGKKERKDHLVRLLEKNQEVLSQWPKENQKTLRECCNAAITKVLNIKQWSQL